MPLKSRIPAIMTQLPVRTRIVAAKGADAVAEGARMRVPVRTGALREAIHVEREEGAGDDRGYSVIAANDHVPYGMLVENGTRHTPAQPFMVPAAEAARREIQAIGIATLRGL